MPELPEVETMVRGLRPALLGKRIRSASVLDPSMVRGCPAAGLEARLAGMVVSGVDRRGKWVVIQLEEGAGIIVIQPRMSGGFWLVPPPRVDHARLTFQLEEPDRTVWYCDTRRLGRIKWYDGADEAESDLRGSHGPDALSISEPELASRLKRTSRGIKPTLMDQKVLAGIGNIYADEVLFASRIHPERMSARLTLVEVSRLHAAIGRILSEAIAAEGASFDLSYRTVLGLEGGFLAQNSMYGRGGEPCHGCGGSVVKTKIKGLIGRPTYLCPVCQPKIRRRGNARPRRSERVPRRST